MSIELPPEIPSTSPPSEPRKRRKIAIVETSESIEKKARDVGEAKLTASKEELKGVKGFFKKIWKHNLAREYYRQKEIKKARQDITSSKNLYISEGADESAHAETMQAITDRFVLDYDEAIHAGEARKTLNDADENEQRIKERIRGMIQRYARSEIGEVEFNQERDVVIQELKRQNPNLIDKGILYADNLYEIAEEVKENYDHTKKLEELDIDFDVVVGKAKSGVRTEAQFNAVDRLSEKIKNSRLGPFMSETTVGAAYSLAATLSQKLVSSRAAAWFTFGGTALVSSGIAAAKESARMEEERRQHFREMAQGKRFDTDHGYRRAELETSRYETASANAMADTLESALYEKTDGDEEKLKDLSQAEFDSVLSNLANIEARVRISDDKNIDLLNYSDEKKVDEERLRLDILRGKAKRDLQRILDSGSVAISGGHPVRAYLESLIGTQMRTSSSEIEQKNRIFSSLKRKQVGKAFLKGLGVGLVIGGVVQEGVAAFRDDKEGVIDALREWAGGSHKILSGVSHYTPLEAARRWLTDHLHDNFGAGTHETIIGLNQNHIQLPNGVDLLQNPDGSYALVHGTKKLADHLAITPNGAFTGDAIDELHRNGIEIRNHTEHIAGTTTVTHSAKEYADTHPGLFGKVKRLLWYDNNTPKPVFEKNELGLWPGGVHNTGIDSHGNFVYNVKHMTPDGSVHGKFSADAQALMKAGKLKLLLSLSRDSQGQAFEVPIDSHGNAVIDPKSDMGKLFFQEVGGKAKFLGQFAEVAQDMGPKGDAESFRILATHVGEGIPSVSEVVPTVENVYKTALEIPSDYRIDPPLFIPILGREPLEPTLAEVSYAYAGRTDRDNPHFRERRSPRLENPNAQLDHFQEVEDYFNKQPESQKRAVEDLVAQIPEPMSPECKINVFVPAAGHQEGDNIYRTLELYKNQKEMDGSPFDFRKMEITVFVNHPKDATPDKTLDEVKRFQRENPGVPVRVMYKALEREEAKIGTIRKYLADAILMRHHRRGKDAEDLILVSNDADMKGLSEKYLANYLDRFAKYPRAEAILGKVDWEPEAYLKSPLVHIGTRFFQYLDIAFRHHISENKKAVGSCGPNFALKSSIYAGVGGYIPENTVAEDMFLGHMIKAARARSDAYPILYGDAASGIVTNARRSVDAVNRGLAPAEQWHKFSADDALRAVRWAIRDTDVNLDSPAYQKKLRAGLQRIFQRTLRVYGLTPRSWETRNALKFLGVKYKIVNRKLILTDISKLITGLKKYKERSGTTTTA